MIWTIGPYISLLIFVVFGWIVFKNIKQMMKTFDETFDFRKYKHQELLDEQPLVGNLNKIFENTLNSNEMIDRYILSFEEKKTFLLCHFNQSEERNGLLEVCCYNDRKQLIYVHLVNDLTVFKASNLMELPSGTSFVNMYLHEDQSKVADYHDIYKKRHKTYHVAAIYESIALLFLLIPLGYFMLVSLSGTNFHIFQNLPTLSIGFGLMIFACLINYLIIYFWIRYHHPIRGIHHES